jgi:hypothetical protein
LSALFTVRTSSSSSRFSIGEVSSSPDDFNVISKLMIKGGDDI